MSLATPPTAASRRVLTWLLAATLALFNALPPAALSPDLVPTQGRSVPAASFHASGAEPVVVPRQVPRFLATKASIPQDAEGNAPSGDQPDARVPDPGHLPRYGRSPHALLSPAGDVRPIRQRLFDPRAPPALVI
jgi:hypothetical protein